VRKLLCKVGLHSKFIQYDKWGSAEVCRYCEWVNQAESCENHMHSMFYECVNGLGLIEYLARAEAYRQERGEQ